MSPRSTLLARRKFRGIVPVISAVALAGLIGGVLAFALPTSASATTISSLWPTTTVPQVTADPDAVAVELGVRFRSDVAGQVVGVRYFKSATNTGTHVGSLWNASGVRLARASFTTETTTGWQTVRFASPVSVQAGQTYVASYHTNTGHYAADNGYFSTSRDSGPLHAPAGTNGVYRYGATGFPSSTFQATNYYVDVLFSGATVTPTPTPTATATATATAPAPTPTATAPAPTPTATAPAPTPTATAPAPTPTATAPAPTPTATAPAPAPTPTPTPPPASGTGCITVPSACGFPDATNTGVPAGTTLRSVPDQVSSGIGWHYDTRGWVSVDGNGAVLDGLRIPYNVDVVANDVTIKNSQVIQPGESFGISLRHAARTIVQNTEIYSPDGGINRLLVGIKDIYGDSTDTQVLRSNIWHTSTGVQIDSGLVQDNYIHDMGFKDGDHLNGTTSNGGSTLLTLRHNTVLNQFGQTDAISLFEDFGVQANRVIDNNLLAGGGYTLYAGQNAGGPAATGITVTNNRFSRLYFPQGGFYGPVAAWNPTGSGNIWTSNSWDDGSGAVNP